MSRLTETRLRKCKLRGDGSCPCITASRCVLLLTLTDEISERERECQAAQSKLNDAMQRLRHLTTQPAKPIDGWTMPIIPAGWRPVVHNEGESWVFGLEDEDGEFKDSDKLGWKYPFDDYSWSDDWERIGFEVV